MTKPIHKGLIDWKGTNAGNKAHIFPMLEDAAIEIIRAKNA